MSPSSSPFSSTLTATSTPISLQFLNTPVKSVPTTNVSFEKQPIHTKSSKLHLIDNTKLTSLPFAPPPDVSVVSEHDDEEIVLIEDYIMDDDLQRKKSLAFLKRSFRSSTRKRDNLEDIFGKLPGTDRLKYCDLCNKPLYELSSHLSKYLSDKTNRAVEQKSAGSHKFKEFVCSSCLELYENLVKDLNGECVENLDDLDVSDFDTSMDTNMSGSPSPLSKKNKKRSIDFQKMVKKRQKLSTSSFSFSTKLIDNFKSLNDPGVEDEEADDALHRANWEFGTIRKKLRWRWRLRGLLPFNNEQRL